MYSRLNSEKPLSKAATALRAFAMLSATVCLCTLSAGLAVVPSASARPLELDADPFGENAATVPGAKSSAIVSGTNSGATAGGAVNCLPSRGLPTQAAAAGAGSTSAATATLATPPTAAASATVANPVASPTAVKASISRYQSRTKNPRTHGDAILPMMVNVAMHPELMDAKYLRMLLGAPDNKGVSSFGMSSMHWSAKAIGSPFIALQAGIANYANKNHCTTDSGTRINRTLLVEFPNSGIRLNNVQKQLGAPLRRYFDDQSQPVECYQLSPNAVLNVTEPANCFDIKKMAVVYNGPPLGLPTAKDYAIAAEYRLALAKRCLAGGNTIRCAELLNEHLKDQPRDAGAHLILAKSMRHYGDINGSITEYRTALSLARTYGVSSVEQEAYAALNQLGLVAKPHTI